MKCQACTRGYHKHCRQRCECCFEPAPSPSTVCTRKAEDGSICGAPVVPGDRIKRCASHILEVYSILGMMVSMASEVESNRG